MKCGLKRGQAVGGIIGLMVALILLVAVVYPVIHDTISDMSLTGTEGTLGDIIPLLILVGGVVLVTTLFSRS
jgi:hypothetical protein